MKTIALLLLAWMAGGVAAADSAVSLPPGARIGIIDMVRPDVTHFHVGATAVKSFMRTYRAGWPVGEIIDGPLIRSLTEAGFEPLSLRASDRLRYEKESWIISKPTAEKLPRGCLKELERLITEGGLAALIIVAESVNAPRDAVSGSRLRELPEYIRGWGFSTSDDDQGRPLPVVFNLTQMLLVTRTTDGVRLEHREWDGNHVYAWPNFVPVRDMKALSNADLAPLRPVIADALKQQIARLVPYLRP